MKIPWGLYAINFLVNVMVFALTLYYGFDMREVAHDVIPTALGLGFAFSSLEIQQHAINRNLMEMHKSIKSLCQEALHIRMRMRDDRET